MPTILVGCSKAALFLHSNNYLAIAHVPKRGSLEDRLF